MRIISHSCSSGLLQLWLTPTPKGEDILKADRGHPICIYPNIKTPHPSKPEDVIVEKMCICGKINHILSS